MINKLKRIINEKRLNALSFIRKIKLRLTLDKNNFEHLKPSFKCRKAWYGSSYGGFYINPNLLNEKSVVYSFGIGKDISFDKRVMKCHKCNVYGFDPTPKAINYIKSLPQNPLFHFYDFGLSTSTKMEKFLLPINKRMVSGSMTSNEFVSEENSIEVQMKSLSDIAKMLGHSRIDVLKIDIEGSEYEVLESILSTNITIVQLLIEFHDRFFEGELKSKKTVELLKEKGFEIFGASINFEEISFINKKHL